MSIEVRCVGLSSDRRTNVWHVMCVCGKAFSPPTTMLAKQSFSCPRCGAEIRADWNEPSAEVVA